VVTFRFWVTRILPVGLFMALTLHFGNLVYLYLTVAFIQMLKVGHSAEYKTLHQMLCPSSVAPLSNAPWQALLCTPSFLQGMFNSAPRGVGGIAITSLSMQLTLHLKLSQTGKYTCGAQRQPTLVANTLSHLLTTQYTGSAVCEQAFTPIVTMVALFIAGLETPTRRLITAVVLIASGTAMASYGVSGCGQSPANFSCIAPRQRLTCPAAGGTSIRRHVQSSFPCLHRDCCFTHHQMKVTQGLD